jgi:hypothetical protein
MKTVSAPHRRSIAPFRFALAFFFALISPKLIASDNMRIRNLGIKDGKTRG